MHKNKCSEKMMLLHASNILDQFIPNVSTAMFPNLSTLENMEKQWKETMFPMFPQQCFLVCQGGITLEYLGSGHILKVLLLG
jgi:hypothetical protein